MKILKLYGHKSNNGGIVHFQVELNRYQGKFKNTYYHFRTGAIQNNRILSLPFIRFFDIILSYFIFPFYLVIKSPDIIEINSSFIKNSFKRDGVYLRLASIFCSKSKIILFNHGWDYNFMKKQLIINPQKIINFFNRFDRIIVLASPVKAQLVKFGINDKNISVITTGIDTNTYKQNFKVRKEKKIQKNILFMSRIEKDKGIIEFINSIPLIILKTTEIVFHIAGSGSLLNTIKEHELCKEYSRYIKFHGYVRGIDKINLLAQSDIFVFPSYHEGCPIVIFEALIAGLPIIYTPVGALPELLTNFSNGIETAVKSSTEIANAVDYLIHNDEKAREMSVTNYAYCKNNFDIANIQNIIQQIYIN